MFGYIVPLKPELKIKDYYTFKGYYCGLCFNIKKQFGNIPRLFLNYDMTFLAIFLDGLSKDKIQTKKITCITHPFKKKVIIINNDALKYASNISIALAYYKQLDDVNDNHSIKSKILKNLLTPYKNKLSAKINDSLLIIENNLKRLYNYEKDLNFSSLDEVSYPFAIIVGKLIENYPHTLKNDSPDLRNELYNFGYFLGKWIYIIDAFDDLKKDIEDNKFNPINILYNKNNEKYDTIKDNVKSITDMTLLNCGYSLSELIKSLDFNKNKDILDNIINLGIIHKYNVIDKKYQKEV